MDQENNESWDESTIVGYCHYCKREVMLQDPEARIGRKKVYHGFCWEQEHDHRKPLKFT